MPNPKLSTLSDDFTAAAINTGVWGTITAGTATLDAVNDQVVLAVPTAAGTNTFGTGASPLYDATGSAVYAQITPAALGSGNTRTIMRLRADANNSMSMRIESGVFRQVLTTGSSSTVTTLPTYDPHQHRWWRIREAAGVFYCDASPDGLNWTNLASTTYTWDATQVSLRFESVAAATEVAGSVSVIAHVNALSGGQFNPDWPQLEYAAGLLWGANTGAMPLDSYVDVSTHTYGTQSFMRGKQYQLDQVRAGEGSVVLTDPAGDFDPESTTSPYSGRLQPFQPLRVRGQWPPTVNLLSRGIATGGDIGGVTLGTITPSIALDLASDTDTTGGSVVTSTTAWMGSAVTQFAVPLGAAAGQRVVHTGQAAVLAGQPYTATIHVRNVIASTTLQVKPHLGWVTAGSTTPSSYVYGSTVTLTGSTTAGWTTLTVTGTPPAGTLGMDVGVTVAATAAAACSVQTDGWQQEHGSTASAWVCPGAWHPVYAGFTEDWESQWAMSGTFATAAVPAADALSILSQQTLSDPLAEEIKAHSPSYLYTLADPSGATSAADQTGNRQPLPIAISKQGAGTLTFGNSITASNLTTGTYTGSSGTVVTLANAGTGSATPSAASFFSLAAIGIKGPQTGAYSRLIAFRYTGPTPSSQADIWTAMDNSHNFGPFISKLTLYIDSSGHLNAGTYTLGTIGGIAGFTSTANVADGNWHLAIMGGQGGASASFFMSLDGAYLTGTAPSSLPAGLISDSIGTFADATVNNTTGNFSGDISYIAEFPSVLTATDCANLYSAWKSACAGESTDARYGRILRYAGYTGTTSLQAGATRSMGPAAISGDAVSALQGVVDTEAGEHYIARDGTPTFKPRTARYNSFTPVYTFGERTDLGEWPYEDVHLVRDSSHLGNEVTVTNGIGQTFSAEDDASIAAYAPRTLNRTANVSSDLEAQDAATYYLNRYKQPFTRVATLVLHPSAMPAMWPVCLALELGTRVRVMRRQQGAPVRQVEAFVENIQWDIDSTNEVHVTLQCSPADPTVYGVFAAWHTTLASSIAAGVSAVTLNAGQDNTNPLIAQLAQGQQLVLGQNTANQETVTVSAVGATSPGWTTGAITLTTPTTKSHSAGDIVCEPLPVGVTDPTTYDYSTFDNVVFAY